MNLPQWAIQHRAIVVAATMLATIWGIVVSFTAPRREDPDFTLRQCVVSSQWPGATAEKVEQLLTKQLEKTLDGLDEVEKVTSISTVGRSIVYVHVEKDAQNIDQVWDKVRASVAATVTKLPPGASEPQVNSNFGDTSTMVLAVYQAPLANVDRMEPRYTHRELEKIVDRLADELQLLDAVARVELFGIQEEAIYLEPAADRWSQLRLTMDQLRSRFQQRNIVAPGGRIDTELGQFDVKVSGEISAETQLQRVMLGTHEDGTPIYLKDLGIQVSRRYEEPARILTRYGEKDLTAPCLVISLSMKKGMNAIGLGRKVRQVLAESRQSILPPDIKVAIISDQPRTVKQKITEFVQNLWQAVVIVILVAFLLIGLRIAIVMAAAIPLVILISIGFARFFGVEIEQVMLASLIIALGMLVDNAIEVGDNAHRLIEEGYSPRDAAVEGSRQIAFPVLIATLTTVGAFLPMLLLEGEEGEFIFSLPVVVSTTLIVSWVLAMTMTTLMACWFLRPIDQHGHRASPISMVIDILLKVLRVRWRPDIGRMYMAVARVSLRYKLVTVAVALGLFAGACSLVVRGHVGTQYFPSAARKEFVVHIFLPAGTSLGRTNKICKQVEDIIRRHSAVQSDGKQVERLRNMVCYIGQSGPRFYYSMHPKEPSSSFAEIIVNTQSPEFVEPYIKQVRATATAELPGVRVVPKALTLGPPLESPIALRLIGPQMDVLRHYANRLKDVVRRAEGSLDVHGNWGEFGYQVFVDVDENKANLAGLSNASIAQALNAFISGHYLTTYRESDKQIPVYLRMPATERGSLAALRAAYMKGSRGSVPLDAVASIKSTWQPNRICRWNLNRSIEVRCRVREGLLANRVLTQVLPEIRELEQVLPAGYRIELGGEIEETTKSQKSMSKCLGVSLILIILCLVILYNSLVKPWIILLTLPMAATGGILGLYITGHPLGFMAMIGLLSLGGVVLNDAIVLVEFIEFLINDRLAKQQGLATPDEKSFAGLNRQSFFACLVEAGRMRMLPILLTTLTTVGGLIPLALFGGPLFEAMAVVVIFGLLLATVLTLLVLPAAYAIFVEYLRLKVAAE